MNHRTITKHDVQHFWEKNTCGTQVATGGMHTKEYFDSIERFRYECEPFIHDLVKFPQWKHKKILEIGMGAGTDFMQFVRNGANAHGVDLTHHSIELITHRLKLEGLSADIQQADAEHLPFADNTFDFVYSWGVIHHTPDTEKAAQEIYRVLKPGGMLLVMLYHKHSFLVWYLALRALLRGELFSKGMERILSEHTEWNNPENPLTKAYTAKEARRLFGRFSHISAKAIKTNSISKNWRGRAFQWLNDHFPQFGWYLIIQGKK